MQLLGTGSYLPDQIVTNEFLATLVDTSDEWIYKRTGIRERHIVKEETTAEMAVKAGERALENADIKAEEIDLIILATSSPDCIIPSTACQVQSQLGAKHAVAFDLNAACTGFIYALNTAVAYLQAGIYCTVMVIGSESFSKLIDWTDRGTCVLFGDGAGAIIIKDGGGLYKQVQYSNGMHGNVLKCGNRDTINPFVSSVHKNYISMDGKEVFKFAINKVPECINELLNLAEIEKDSIKYVILHQANIRIIQSIAKRLEMSEDKFPSNLEHCGNTSAASIPILLDELNRLGQVQKEDKIILSGFGGGLTWGAILFEW